MAYNHKQIISEKPSRLTSGHRMCAGCGAPSVARMILRAVKPEDHVVVSNATGCLEVASCIYPYTSWSDSYIHTAFEKFPVVKRQKLICKFAEYKFKSKFVFTFNKFRK